MHIEAVVPDETRSVLLTPQQFYLICDAIFARQLFELAADGPASYQCQRISVPHRVCMLLYVQKIVLIFSLLKRSNTNQVTVNIDAVISIHWRIYKNGDDDGLHAIQTSDARLQMPLHKLQYLQDFIHSWQYRLLQLLNSLNHLSVMFNLASICPFNCLRDVEVGNQIYALRCRIAYLQGGLRGNWTLRIHQRGLTVVQPLA